MAEQLAQGQGGTYYTPFPVLGLACDGEKTFLTAGGGGSMSVKEVPNVVQAHTYDEENGKLNTIASLNTGKSLVVHLSFSKEAGLWLASAKNGTKVLALDAAENTLTEVCGWETQPEGKSSEQNFAKYSADAKLMVTGGTEGIAKVWKVGKKDEVPALHRELEKTKEVVDASFSADAKWLAVVDTGGDVRLLEVEQDDDKGKVIPFQSTLCPGKLLVKFVDFFVEDGKPLMVLSASGARGPAVVGVFGLDGVKISEAKVLKSEPLKSVALDSTGKLLVIGTMSGGKKVYSLPGLRCVKETGELHALPSQAVAFLGDRTAISVSGDRAIHLLNYKAGGDFPVAAASIAVLIVIFLLLFIFFFMPSPTGKQGEL